LFWALFQNPLKPKKKYELKNVLYLPSDGQLNETPVVKVGKLFLALSLTFWQNKLACFSLTSLSSIAKHLCEKVESLPIK